MAPNGMGIDGGIRLGGTAAQELNGGLGADFGQGIGGGAGSPVSEARVAREMQLNGLEAPAPGGDDKGFLGMLQNSLEKVNLDQVQADHAIKELVAGRSKNIHETMLTIERADTSLKMMMQVRNKILDAYREIMRMQV